MATKFLVEPDSFLLVEPGSFLLVEGDPAVFAFKTIDVAARAARGMIDAREPVMVAAASRRIAVASRASAGSAGTASRRVRVTGL